ncbi:MAG: hypothetical protein AAFU71_16170 [Cyanobacteria bacterium J06632_22]
MLANWRLLLAYFLWGVAIALSYSLIHLSLIPGRLGDAIFASCLIPLVLLNWLLAYVFASPLQVVVVLAGLVFLVILVVRISILPRLNRSAQPVREPRRLIRCSPWLLPSAVFCLCVSTMAVLTRLPSRIALAHSQADFHVAVTRAITHERQTTPQQMGIYTVTQHAKDPRGGVYFVVNETDSTGFMSAGYVVSRGYAYRPNAAGSPFGNESYLTWHLFGDWYEFQSVEPISR